MEKEEFLKILTKASELEKGKTALAKELIGIESNFTEVKKVLGKLTEKVGEEITIELEII